MVVLGVSTPSLIAGQSKLGLSLRGVRGVGKPASQTMKTQAMKQSGLQVLGQLAKWGAYAYFGTEAMKYAIRNIRPEMAETSRAYGYGLLKGESDAYQEAYLRDAPIRSQADAQLYTQNSPTYIAATVNRTWAERKAQYDASIAYPMEYGQATTKTNTQKMPYTPRII